MDKRLIKKIAEGINNGEKVDSTIETKKHIETVKEYCKNFALELIVRSMNHDKSKLGDIEKPLFDEYTPKLKNSTYGSEEYKKFLEELKPALNHHYENNSHHPEHYSNGIQGMDLFDLVEMFFDWKAASKRHEDGNLLKSIDINKERFNMSDDLVAIFKNTENRIIEKNK